MKDWEMFRFLVYSCLLLTCIEGYKIKCLNGWSGFSESQSCYKFISTDETFEGSESNCQDFGGKLATINTKPERDFIATNIGHMSGEDHSKTWWLGLKKSDGGVWTWYDGSTLDEQITPWEQGFPDETSLCGILNLKGKLETYDCAMTKSYVCEMPLGAPALCEEGWEHNEKSCYKLYLHEKRTYDEAREMCMAEDSDLVVVKSFAENTFIYEATKAGNIDIWLGLRENGTNQYLWVDGTVDGHEGSFSDWNEDQPVFNQGLNAGCMEATSNSKWTSKPYVERLGFVCEKGVGEFCQFDTIGHGSSCYDFLLDSFSDESQYFTAESKCQEIGMHLLTIEDQEENDWINNYLRNAGVYPIGVWMGYIETGSNTKAFRRITDNATVADGSGDTFHDFSDFNVYDKYDVDVLYLDVCPEGEETCEKNWKVELPHFWKVRICEFEKGTVLNVSGVMHPKMECPEGWDLTLAGYCYLRVEETLTWAKAQSYCKDQEINSNLVSILTPYEDDFVLELIGDDYAWIGYSDRTVEGTWKWIDESVSSYTNWYPGEPNGGKRENCGEIRFRAWNDLDCATTASHFICKIKGKSSGDPILPETTTIPTSPNCGFGSGWVEHPATGMCYHFIDEGLKWIDAREECKLRAGFRESGDLASINSFEEQLFIHSFLVGSGSDVSHWIGLNDFDSSRSFKWSDGTPVSYINWDDGEPNYDYENCAEMVVSHNGMWNDMECDQNQPAICEKRGSNYIEPQKPTLPPLTCPDGWKLSLDRCYYFSADFGLLTSNWTEAEETCRGLYQGATLASIRNQEEQDFIHGSIATTAFVGGTDIKTEGTWEWSDGSPWVYENWYSNQPNGGTEENCLEVVTNTDGQWHDIFCQEVSDEKKGFVCSFDNFVCPEHWRLFDGSCWHTSNGEVTSWHAARDICKDVNVKADLASIHSHSENSYISKRVQESAWVGLTRNQGEENLHWIDGSKFDYHQWAESEPDNPDNQFCGAVYNDAHWKTEICEDSREFACKMKTSHYYSCPPGWEKYDGFCYLIQAEDLSWNAARDSCITRGGNLASILSVGEGDFIKSIAHITQKCPEGWVSDDELSMCFYLSSLDSNQNWPDAIAKCNEMDAQLVEIRDSHKASRIQALDLTPIYSFWAAASDAEEEGIWKWHSDNTETSYTDWDTEYATEPNGGTSENCLMIWNDRAHRILSWNDSPCESWSYDFICEKPFLDTTPAHKWIGLNDKDQHQSFEWSDGMPMLYTNWDAGLPNKHTNDPSNCNFMSGDTDLWNHADCAETYHSVCKRRQEITNIPPEVYGCEEGQIEYEASCYHLVYQNLGTLAAESECVKSGGHLLTINNEYEQDKIASILATNQDVFHIGLKYNSNSQSFEWLSGEEVTYTNWKTGEPDPGFDDHGEGKCVNLADERALGKWIVTTCGARHPFICELPRQGYTTPPPPPTTTPEPEAQCHDSSWKKHNNHCYKVFESDFKTFADARAFCQSYGGDLVSVGDYDEDRIVYGLGTFNAWIGLQESLEEGYSWVDGTPFDFTNWMSGYPSTGGVDLCVATDSYTWYNYHCDHLSGMVCEVIAGIEPPTTQPPPTTPPKRNCDGHPDGWILGPGEEYCYKFIAGEATWMEAENACQTEEAHLVSILSPQENAFVALEFKDIGASEGWIGLNALTPDSSFAWADGSPLDYVFWAAGEPSNYAGMESCVFVYSYDSRSSSAPIFAHWNDVHCEVIKNGYSCMKPRHGGFTTPTPTQSPVGHCPSDHAEHKGYCFKIEGLDSPATWSDAQANCRSLGQGYHLASVHGPKDSAHLGALVAETGAFTDYWIGLHDINYNFAWEDQSKFDYSNWAPNQPNSYDDCAIMYGDGYDYHKLSKWNDVSCSDSYPYICRVKASMSHPEPPPIQMCSGQHSHFASFDDECYYFIAEEKTWTEAESECQTHGAHLVTINNIAIQLYLENQINVPDAWIGLSNHKDHTYFNWADGWEFYYANWADGSPPLQPTEDLCVSYNSTDAKWYHNACDKRLPFMCKYTEKPVPTESPFGKCPEGFGEVSHNEFCYFIHRPETRLKSIQWSDALSDCVQKGGSLASIHSKEENHVIHSLLANIKLRAWIGLFLSDTGNYIWADLTPFNGFAKWDTDEPSDPDTEKCVEMKYLTGNWSDTGCNDYAVESYICKAKRIQPISSTEGTTDETQHTTVSEHTTHPHETTHTTHPHETTHTAHTISHHSTTHAHPTTTTRNVVTPAPQNAGLSAGATAAIVIMVLLVVGSCLVFFYMWRTREQQMRKMLGLSSELGETRRRPNTQGSGFENIAYDASTQQLSSSSKA